MFVKPALNIFVVSDETQDVRVVINGCSKYSYIYNLLKIFHSNVSKILQLYVTLNFNGPQRLDEKFFIGFC